MRRHLLASVLQDASYLLGRGRSGVARYSDQQVVAWTHNLYLLAASPLKSIPAQL